MNIPIFKIICSSIVIRKTLLNKQAEERAVNFALIELILNHKKEYSELLEKHFKNFLFED